MVIKLKFVLVVMVVIVGQAMGVNLIGNGGFDSGDLTGWALGAEATATVAPDATAPSAPYIVTFSNGANPETSYLAGPGAYPVLPNHVYSVGYYLRDIDGTLDTADNRAVFEDGGYQYTCTANSMATATSNWQNIQRTKLSPSNATGYFYNSFRIATPNGSVQADSFYLEDVTYGNRMPNGGFENSSTNLLNWSVYNATANTMTAAIVTGAGNVVEGQNALLLSKTTADDSALHIDDQQLPWRAEDHVFQLLFSVKDVPTISVGDYVRAVVGAFDAAGNWNGWTDSLLVPAGIGSYANYSQIFSNLPDDTASITMNFRIKDATGADIAGDVLLDNVQVVIPEPVTICMLGLGGLGLLRMRKSHSQQ